MIFKGLGVEPNLSCMVFLQDQDELRQSNLFQENQIIAAATELPPSFSKKKGLGDSPNPLISLMVGGRRFELRTSTV